jgi:hypothetical protein
MGALFCNWNIFFVFLTSFFIFRQPPQGEVRVPAIQGSKLVSPKHKKYCARLYQEFLTVMLLPLPLINLEIMIQLILIEICDECTVVCNHKGIAGWEVLHNKESITDDLIISAHYSGIAKC